MPYFEVLPMVLIGSYGKPITVWDIHINGQPIEFSFSTIEKAVARVNTLRADAEMGMDQS